MSQRLPVLQKFRSKPNTLRVVSANFSGGEPRPGAETGPSALVNFGLLSQLQKVSYDIDFAACNPEDPIDFTSKSLTSRGMNRPNVVSDFTQALSQEVYDHSRQGKPVLTLGGDHSIAIGTLTGIAKAMRKRFDGQEIAVIYVDAHADINTPETSPSGNIHGMPVAFATGIAKSSEQGSFGWIEKEHLINVKKVVYIGLRDVDDEEWEIIHKYGIKAFDMAEVKEKGIEKIMDMTLEYIGDKIPIHLSYDIDSLDPEWAPSTIYPVDGGLTLTEGTHIARRIYETGNLVAMDLVEINPAIETARLDLTLQSGCSVVYSALSGVDV